MEWISPVATGYLSLRWPSGVTKRLANTLSKGKADSWFGVEGGAAVDTHAANAILVMALTCPFTGWTPERYRLSRTISLTAHRQLALRDHLGSLSRGTPTSSDHVIRSRPVRNCSGQAGSRRHIPGATPHH